MKTKIIIYLFLFLLIYSCKNKKQNNTNVEINYNMENKIFNNMPVNQKELIKKCYNAYFNEDTIKKYNIDDGASFYAENYLTANDNNAMVEMITSEFFKVYKPVKEDIFNARLKEVFGFTSNNIPNSLIFKKRSENCIEINFDGEEESHNFWLCRDEHIIIPTYEYIGIEYDSREDINDFHMYYDTTLMYYNKYLFDKTPSVFTWLRANDKEFLLDLLRTFGYDKDTNLNALIMTEIEASHDVNRYKNIFAAHSCIDGKLQIHEGLMKYIADSLYNKGGGDILRWFIFDIVQEKEDGVNTSIPKYLQEFSVEERYTIAAYAGYYLELMIQQKGINKNNDMDYDKFSNILYINNDFYDYIQKNKYFGLKDFEKLLEVAYDREESIQTIYRERFKNQNQDQDKH